METVNLIKWQLCHENDNGQLVFYLTGTAERHPKLGRNAVLAFTSSVVNFEVDRDKKVVTFETRNTKYICDFKFFDIDLDQKVITTTKNMDAKTRELSNFSNECVSFAKYVRLKESTNSVSKKNVESKLDEWYDLLAIGTEELKERKIDENKELISNASKYSNCIYVEVETISRGTDIAYNINGEVGILESRNQQYVESNMIEYSDRQRELLFKYVSFGNIIEVHNISDNIEKVVIHNNKGYNIIVDMLEHSYELSPDETKEITI
jgi:hypothetical protein